MKQNLRNKKADPGFLSPLLLQFFQSGSRRVRFAGWLFFFVLLFFSHYYIPEKNNWKEIIPLFHWNLFGAVPIEHKDYIIQVEPDKNRKACNVLDCEFLNIKDRNRVRYYMMVQSFGKELEKGLSKDGKRHRQIETLFFCGGSFSLNYSLYIRISDPLKLMKHGRYKKKQLLKTFFYDSKKRRCE